MNLIEALKALDEGKKIKSPLFWDDVRYISKRRDGKEGYEDESGIDKQTIFRFLKSDLRHDFDDFEDNFSIYEPPLLTDEERSFVKNLLGDFIDLIDTMMIRKETDDKYHWLFIWYEESDVHNIDFPILKSRFEFKGLQSGWHYTPKELGLV